MLTLQDIIIAAANVLFSLFLIPTILSPKSKVPVLTSLCTGSALIVEAFVFLSLGLLYSFFTTLVSGAFWFVIAVYRSEVRPRPVTPAPAAAPSPSPPAREWMDYWVTVRRTITNLDKQIQSYEIQMYTILSFLAVLAFTLTRLIPTDLYSLALRGIAEGVAVAGVIIAVAIGIRAYHFVRLLKGAVATGEAVEDIMFASTALPPVSPVKLTRSLSGSVGPMMATWTAVLASIAFVAVFSFILLYALFLPPWF